jgi:hypothetical protein
LIGQPWIQTLFEIKLVIRVHGLREDSAVLLCVSGELNKPLISGLQLALVAFDVAVT